MTTEVEIGITLEIDGEEIDCLVTCDMEPAFNGGRDEPSFGAGVTVTKVCRDNEEQTEIPEIQWPKNLTDLVYDQACEAASPDPDDYDEPEWDEDR